MDLSEIDFALLNYARFIGERFPVEKAYFFHVSPGLELNTEVAQLYRDMDIKPVPPDEQIRMRMEEEVGRKIKTGLFETEFDVVEGSVTHQLLHWSEIKQADLVLLGKKYSTAGSGISARRFLRNAPCSVLFVPEKSHTSLGRILVTTDFSPDSTLALRQAIELALTLHPHPEIHLLNVYQVPDGVHYQIGRTYAHFASMIRENIEDYIQKYLQRIDNKGITIIPALIQNNYTNIARHIYEYAGSSHSDMLLIGAQGHSALSSFLMGSITEKTLAYDFDIPIWVIRPLHDAGAENTLMREKLQNIE
ncbi:MAG: universal stress protein [Bacteroidia bacterium]